jgi:hypothetical protein
MSLFSFTTPDGKTFEINAPQGVTEAQAKAIFDQQLNTGSLTGFKVGDSLSAVTQAADGLASAQAVLAQTTGSASGALGAAANLNTIAASLGAGAATAAQQVGASLKGSLAGLASLTTGASAAVNGALSGVTGAITGAVGAVGSALGSLTGSVASVFNAASSQVSSVLGSVASAVLPVNKNNPVSAVLNNPLTGAAGQIGSLASTAVATLTRAVSGGLPTAAISAADFVKQVPAVAGIGNLSAADVTGTLASVEKMVGQLPTQLNNNLGVGKFGFDIQQLQNAGMVKPGTAESFLAQGDKDIVEVLKSPTVWTGKDGIKSLNGLLGNSAIQDKVQTDLMSKGLDAVNGAGVPVNSLTPQALSGVAAMAAKSVSDTVNFVKGLASNIPTPPGLPQIPGKDQLAPNVTSAFNNVVKNNSFAVNLTQQKIERPFKQEEPVQPAANTVDTETQTAAAQRVIGNDKVPNVSVTDGSFAAAQVKVQAFLDLVDNAYLAVKEQTVKVEELEKASSVTQAQIDAINAALVPSRAVYNSRKNEIQKEAALAVNALPVSASRARLVSVIERIQEVMIPALLEYNKAFKQRLKNLADRITT